MVYVRENIPLKWGWWLGVPRHDLGNLQMMLVGGLVAILYFPIYWESSSQLTNIFQRGGPTTNQDGFSHLVFFSEVEPLGESRWILPERSSGIPGIWRDLAGSRGGKIKGIKKDLPWWKCWLWIEYDLEYTFSHFWSEHTKFGIQFFVIFGEKKAT